MSDRDFEPGSGLSRDGRWLSMINFSVGTGTFDATRDTWRFHYAMGD